MTIVLPLLASLFIALIVGAVAMVLAPAGGGMVEQRLGEIRGARVMLGGVEAAEERRDVVEHDTNVRASTYTRLTRCNKTWQWAAEAYRPDATQDL